MDTTKNIAALFDFDGVVMDTETQYSVFWDELGRRYHPEIKDFGRVIKGQTLTQIYDKYFAGDLQNYSLSDAEIEKNLAELDDLKI